MIGLFGIRQLNCNYISSKITYIKFLTLLGKHESPEDKDSKDSFFCDVFDVNEKCLIMQQSFNVMYRIHFVNAIT